MLVSTVMLNVLLFFILAQCFTDCHITRHKDLSVSCHPNKVFCVASVSCTGVLFLCHLASPSKIFYLGLPWPLFHKDIYLTFY